MKGQTQSFLEDLHGLFYFNAQDARDIMLRFHSEMGLGLTGKESSLKMIPSFVRRPKGKEKGSFLAIDLGGTNIRVLAVSLDGKGRAEPLAISRYPISHEAMTGTGDMFFDFIAESMESFFKEHQIDAKRLQGLGFTFSFPVVQSSIASGRLISWTKGFSASGVEGEDVVELLTRALRRRNMGFIEVAALINDTVGTLVAKSYANPACDMGVILGTGTNAAYPEKTGRITKYKGPRHPDEMIINIEWGGFNKIRRNIYDETLDRGSFNPGEQRMEKMVSGMYLGEIARLIIMDMVKEGLLLNPHIHHAFSEPYRLTAEHLSLAEQGHFFDDFGLIQVPQEDREIILEVFRLVSGRSARIAATAISAVITWMDKKMDSSHVIAIDGSLFEKYPNYRENMEAMLREIFGDSAGKIKLEKEMDGSGIGAAITAAIASSPWDKSLIARLSSLRCR
ncbi:MAG TPA: hypothetical protein PLR38_03160 [Syntrophorhabdaceae bacterium]|nr:hypothetical protein [Syntrophorhabdaceae bacterium]HOL04992.1 hypothetical protein [Syntrophorhabdaceae bacterium]HPP41165.1 hypothetical protein [Syntrophorhabdaceae bacterium]HQK47093.1 hypothetical protein [Syntrophorhabdaceae bacterium]